MAKKMMVAISGASRWPWVMEVELVAGINDEASVVAERRDMARTDKVRRI